MERSDPPRSGSAGTSREPMGPHKGPHGAKRPCLWHPPHTPHKTRFESSPLHRNSKRHYSLSSNLPDELLESRIGKHGIVSDPKHKRGLQVANSCSLLLLNDLLRHGSIAMGLSSTPKTLLSWGPRIHFQRFSVGSCGYNRKIVVCPAGVGWVSADAGRDARYSSGASGGN